MIIFSIIVILGIIYFILRESRPEWVKGYLITIGILLSIVLISVTSVITEKLMDLSNITILEDNISITNQEAASPQDISIVKGLIKQQPVPWEGMNGDVWVDSDGIVYLSYEYLYNDEKVKGLFKVYNGEIESLK
jgi:hypothetical protein